MKHLRFFKMTIALVASLLSAQSTFAQGTITSFEAEPQTLGSGGITTEGSFGYQDHPLPNSTISAQLDLNANERTATFRRVEVNIEPLSISGDIATGFGQSVLIEGTINFDPVIFTDDKALQLRAGQGQSFVVDDPNWRNWNNAPSRLTGSYEFSGPTESIKGTFDTSNTNYVWGRQSGLTIDTTNYPNSVTITDSPEWIGGLHGSNIFTESIDGADILFEFAHWQTFQPPNNWEFTPQIIPEPSEYALMIGGLLIAFVAFRRRGFLKSG